MDPFTHVVLGGATAQLLFHRQLGRKAVVLGALAAALPDVDVLIRYDQWAAWVHHRGFTHSIWFPFIAGPLFGWLAWRWSRWRGRRKWYHERHDDQLFNFMAASTLGMATHAALDWTTSYGTQLLAPFSDQRFAIDAMPIIDPLYTLPLALAVILGLWFSTRRRLVMLSAAIALIFSTAYIGYGWYLNQEAAAAGRLQLAQHGVTDATVRAYPSIFQVFLRRVVALRPGEVQVAYHTILSDKPLVFRTAPMADNEMVRKVRQSHGGKVLSWFAMGQDIYRIAKQSDGFLVEGNDIRYGLPGPADHSLWGVRAKFDVNGRQTVATYRFRRATPPINAETLRRVFLAAIGDPRSGF